MSFWNTARKFFKKLNIELPYHPATLLLGRSESIYRKICTQMSVELLFIIAPKQKQPKCPTGEHMNKMWFIYTMDYYAAIKRNNILIRVMT